MSSMALEWKKDLNLVYYFIPIWNSSREPSGPMGLKLYFFVPLYSHWGCNNNLSNNHGQWLLTKIKRHACISSFMKPCHARRLVPQWHIHWWQWVCQNYQCQVAQSSEHHGVSCMLLWKLLCSESKGHHHISGDKMVPHVEESLALVPLLMSCSSGGNMQTLDGSTQVRPGFCLIVPRFGAMSLQCHLSGTL